MPDSPPPPVARGTIRFGHSPDPDDAFMFYGFAEGATTIRGYRVEHVLRDIQTLNEIALAGHDPLEVTAISAHAYPRLADRYAVLFCGASMGKGYGPIVVAREDGPGSIEDLAGKRVAIPGELTTAYLVAQLLLPDFDALVHPFDQIPEAVATGAFDAGIVIHEGQITYGDRGLVRIVDLGEAWFEETALPLPLGLDVVRKDLGPDLMREIARGFAASIDYAFAHEEAAVAYALDFGRGLDTERTRRFVRMYVNDLTLDMGEEGRRALDTLFRRAAGAELIEPVDEIEVVRPPGDP